MRYASIRSMDITNGENIGVSLFVQGCPFQCYNCFNSTAWDFNGGKEWNNDTKKHFLDLIDKPYIKRISILGGEPLASSNLDGILELLQEIRTEYPASPNLTPEIHCKMGNFSSQNFDQIRISYPTKTIWLYTGYTLEDCILKPDEIVDDHNYDRFQRYTAIKMVDVLIDGPYVDAQRDVTAKWSGSTNQRVINIPETLKQQKVVLYCD